MKNNKPHVIVLTYPAQGHINPLLQFAKRLASKGLKSTLATTRYTLNSIQSTLVNIEPISDGYDELGFAQAPSQESYLESFKSNGSKTLSDIIKKFQNSDSPVNCIVFDSLLPWALDVARNFGIHGASFMTNSGSVSSVLFHISNGVLDLPIDRESTEVCSSLPGLGSLRFCDLPTLVEETRDSSPYMRVILDSCERLGDCDFVFCNSFEELESELLKAMRGLWPLVMVGPMVPSAYLDQQIEGDNAYGASLWKPTSEQCLKWLDTKPQNSVIYISFGSMANLSTTQIEEIAWGLKASGMHFLWIMKDSKDHLPIEFCETGLIMTWCNQLEILTHDAVGCFVTHCGWNSTLEALSLGVPMVAISERVDQPTNAKFVEDLWGVGVRAKKNEDGIVTREQIERCIREVLVGERSGKIKKNASKWSEIAKRALCKGGSSDRNIDDFVDKLMKGK